MKRFVSGLFASGAVIAAGTATAADLPALDNNAPVLTAPAFTWTGCYAGAQTGVGVGHTTWRDVNTPGDIDLNASGNIANTNPSGAVYGGQLGCDYQFVGGYVVGLQGMFAASTISATGADQFNPIWTLRDQADWLGSLTGRIGTAIGERALLYGRGGAALAHDKFEIENAGFNLGAPSTTRVGWTLGAGMEYALSPCLSVFLEANYYDFVGKTVSFAGNPAAPNTPFTVNSSLSLETFTVGVNYRFWTAQR